MRVHTLSSVWDWMLTYKHPISLALGHIVPRPKRGDWVTVQGTDRYWRLGYEGSNVWFSATPIDRTKHAVRELTK